MKPKHLARTLAALLPLTAFAQTPPAPPAPPAPAAPAAPAVPPPPPTRGHHDERPKVPVTFLGVETSEVPTVVCEQLGLPKGFGLVVDYVVPDGPAAAGGVQQNDIIKQLNDQILTDPGQLGKLVRSYQDGANVTLTVLRKGQEQKLTVKLTKKEVSRRNADMGRNWNFDFDKIGDPSAWAGVDLNGLKDQLGKLKEQLGDEKKGLMRDAVMRARDEVERAREQMRADRDRVRTITRNQNGSVSRTMIDLGKAQIAYNDDKGSMTLETREGKKMLTAKDPQGKLLFSGPVETKEEVDKLPPEVKQRFEQLQQRDLPAVAPGAKTRDSWTQTDNDADDDNDDDADDDNDDDGGTSSMTNTGLHVIRPAHVTPAVWTINQTLL